MKEITKEKILTIIFLIIIIGFALYGSYRNKQIDSGKVKIVYQYGGDL